MLLEEQFNEKLQFCQYLLIPMPTESLTVQKNYIEFHSKTAEHPVWIICIILL